MFLKRRFACTKNQQQHSKVENVCTPPSLIPRKTDEDSLHCFFNMTPGMGQQKRKLSKKIFC